MPDPVPGGFNPDDSDKKFGIKEESQQSGPEENSETQDILRGEKLEGYSEEYFTKIAEILSKYDNDLNEHNIETCISNLKLLIETGSKLDAVSDCTEKYNLLLETLNQEDFKKTFDQITGHISLCKEICQDFVNLLQEMTKEAKNDEVEKKLQLSLHDRIANGISATLDWIGLVEENILYLNRFLDKLDSLNPEKMGDYPDALSSYWYDFPRYLDKLAQNAKSTYRAYFNFTYGLKLLIPERKEVIETNAGDAAYGDNVYRSGKQYPEYFPPTLTELLKSF